MYYYFINTSFENRDLLHFPCFPSNPDIEVKPSRLYIFISHKKKTVLYILLSNITYRKLISKVTSIIGYFPWAGLNCSKSNSGINCNCRPCHIPLTPNSCLKLILCTIRSCCLSHISDSPEPISIFAYVKVSLSQHDLWE